MCVTLVIYQESLHDARSTKYKILQCKTSKTKILKVTCRVHKNPPTQILVLKLQAPQIHAASQSNLVSAANVSFPLLLPPL